MLSEGDHNATERTWMSLCATLPTGQGNTPAFDVTQRQGEVTRRTSALWATGTRAPTNPSRPVAPQPGLAVEVVGQHLVTSFQNAAVWFA